MGGWFLVMGGALLAGVVRFAGKEIGRVHPCATAFYFRLVMGSLVYVGCAYVIVRGIDLLLK